ncbi:MAG: hypothetical protein ABI068_09425, partial [Ktedonobacterales bacterium]
LVAQAYQETTGAEADLVLGDKSAMCAEVYSLAQLAETIDEQEKGYQAALTLARDLRDPAMQARIATSLAVLETRREGGDAQRMREELITALQFARQVEQPDLIVEAVWWLAELDRLEGNISSACAGFKVALEIYKQLNHPDAEITQKRLEALACA